MSGQCRGGEEEGKEERGGGKEEELGWGAEEGEGEEDRDHNEGFDDVEANGEEGTIIHSFDDELLPLGGQVV